MTALVTCVGALCLPGVAYVAGRVLACGEEGRRVAQARMLARITEDLVVAVWAAERFLAAGRGRELEELLHAVVLWSPTMGQTLLEMLQEAREANCTSLLVTELGRDALGREPPAWSLFSGQVSR